jgi:hypothetical protein
MCSLHPKSCLPAHVEWQKPSSGIIRLELIYGWQRVSSTHRRSNEDIGRSIAISLRVAARQSFAPIAAVASPPLSLSASRRQAKPLLQNARAEQRHQDLVIGDPCPFVHSFEAVEQPDHLLIAVAHMTARCLTATVATRISVH